MQTDLSPIYDWDYRFWPTVYERRSQWAALATDEDRLVFELEVEGMLKDSIPKQLDTLRRAYDQCQRLDRLHGALAASAANRDELFDAEDVLAQLNFRIGEFVQDGWIFPPAEPLPFAEHQLAAFVQEAKVVALMTLWTFVRSFPSFLESLPAVVRIALNTDLIEVVMMQLTTILREPTPVLPE